MSDLEALHDLFDRLGKSLAKAFNAEGIEGGGWTHSLGSRRAVHGSLRLIHPSGLGIAVYQRNSRERLTVEGIFPSAYYGDRPSAITVGLHRPPVPMAKDIIRRVLPAYLAKIGVALEAAKEAEQDRQGRIAMNRRLARVLPNVSIGPTPLHEAADRKTSYWSGGAGSLSPCPAVAPGQVSLSNDGQVMAIKLTDVPAELGLQILSLLDPHRVVEGTIAPRAAAEERRELEQGGRVIVGEVVATSDDGPAAGSTAPTSAVPQLTHHTA